MRFFSIFSAFMITAAVAAPMPGPAAVPVPAPAPLRGPETAVRDVDATAVIKALKARTANFKQIRSETEKHDNEKSDDSEDPDAIFEKVLNVIKYVASGLQEDIDKLEKRDDPEDPDAIFEKVLNVIKYVASGLQEDIDKLEKRDGPHPDEAVQKIGNLIKNIVSKFQGDIGNIQALVAGLRNITSGGGILSKGIGLINNAAILLGGDSAKIGNQLLTSKLVDDLGKQSTYDALVPLLQNAKPLLDANFINNVVGLVNGIAPIVSAVGELLDFLGKIL